MYSKEKTRRIHDTHLHMMEQRIAEWSKVAVTWVEHIERAPAEVPSVATSGKKPTCSHTGGSILLHQFVS
jgi:hypothetical protein